MKWLAAMLVVAVIAGWGLYDHHHLHPLGLALIWPIGGPALCLGAGFVAWSALVLPKGTPGAIVRRLAAAAGETLDTPLVRERRRCGRWRGSVRCRWSCRVFCWSRAAPLATRSV